MLALFLALFLALARCAIYATRTLQLRVAVPRTYLGYTVTLVDCPALKATYM